MQYVRNGSERQRDIQSTKSIGIIVLISTAALIFASIASRDSTSSSKIAEVPAARGQDLLQTSHPENMYSPIIASDAFFTKLAAIDQIFSGAGGQPTFLPDIVEKINSGNMKCCARAGADIPPPAYSGAYGDWPKILCIPGYRLDNSLPAGQDCVMCDAGTYCPIRDAQVYRCPHHLWSRPGSVELPDCWCSPGYYGKAGVQARVAERRLLPHRCHPPSAFVPS